MPLRTVSVPETNTIDFTVLAASYDTLSLLGYSLYSASDASGAMIDTNSKCLYAVPLPNDAQKYDVANANVRRPGWSSRTPLYISSLTIRGTPMTPMSASRRSVSRTCDEI